MSLPIGIFVDSDGAGDFSTKILVQEIEVNSTWINISVGGPTGEQLFYYYLFSGTIVHSLRARAITYSMFAINWILTLCSIITTSAMFNRRGEVKEAVALLPVTVILTIPVVRSLYSGSPPYGIHLGKHREVVPLPFQ